MSACCFTLLQRLTSQNMSSWRVAFSNVSSWRGAHTNVSRWRWTQQNMSSWRVALASPRVLPSYQTVASDDHRLNWSSTTARPFSTSRVVSKKESTLGKLKQMIKDYWYIIIPVEIVTSVGWYGAIFLSLKSGVDIIEILTNMGLSQETLSRLPAAGGDAGYHALSFICYKAISPVRHGISLAISAAVVARLEKTRPGYLKTSSDIVQEAKETGDDMREKYNEKLAEGREKYNEKLAEGKEKVEDMKTRAREKRDDMKEKYDDWKKK